MTDKDKFIEGVISLGKELNISLAHEDTQGAFVLHTYNEFDSNWLRDVYDERGKVTPGFTSLNDTV